MKEDSWHIGLTIFVGRMKFALGMSLLAAILIPLIKGRYDLFYSLKLAAEILGVFAVIYLMIAKQAVSEVLKELEKEGLEWKQLQSSPDKRTRFFMRLGYNQFYLKRLGDF